MRSLPDAASPVPVATDGNDMGKHLSTTLVACEDKLTNAFPVSCAVVAILSAVVWLSPAVTDKRVFPRFPKE